jgi:hypothetical protein
VSGIVRIVYQRLHKDDFPDYEVELRKAVADCRTLLDVGCGSSSPIEPFSSGLFSTGIDAFQPSINKSRKAGIHNEYRRMDVLSIGKEFKAHSFDCVLASDLIEHLTKKDGVRLLNMMERIARERVIVFTPNGFLSQGEFDCNPWEGHKSGWTVAEMKERGYEVVGINGWKPLGRKVISMKSPKRRFWKVLSDITEVVVKSRPEKAFQILCVKRKDTSKKQSYLEKGTNHLLIRVTRIC